MHNDLEKQAPTIQYVSAKTLFPIIRQLLNEHQQASFTVTGMSMWPFLCHGRDQVVLDYCSLDSLKVGDILLFQTEQGNYLLHRVTALRKHQFQATGDGNYFRDGWFAHDCIIGRVVYFIRKDKQIDCCNVKYRLLSRLWMILFPFRRLLFPIWLHIRRYIRK